MKKVFEVNWTVKLTRYIEASSKQEALEISEDMGNVQYDEFEVTPMRAKVATDSESIAHRDELLQAGGSTALMYDKR